VVDLEGIFRKLDRAVEHLDALNETAERFFEDSDDEIYALHGETNSQRTKHLFRVELLQPLPLIEWGLIVGDAVHCLRSALDQLAYSFCGDPDGNTAFPISRTRKEWVTKSPAMLWGIPDPVTAVIDRAQPYHCGEGDKAEAHPLAVLNTLWNTDKHKFIPVVALVPASAEWNITGTQGMASYKEVRLKAGRVFEDRAVVADMSFVPDDSGLEPQVEMHGNISFNVAFGKTGVPKSISRKQVIPAVAALGERVEAVLRDLNTALGGTVAEQLAALQRRDPRTKP